jgi:hypothetical protein
MTNTPDIDWPFMDDKRPSISVVRHLLVWTAADYLRLRAAASKRSHPLLRACHVQDGPPEASYS